MLLSFVCGSVLRCRRLRQKYLAKATQSMHNKVGTGPPLHQAQFGHAENDESILIANVQATYENPKTRDRYYSTESLGDYSSICRV